MINKGLRERTCGKIAEELEFLSLKTTKERLRRTRTRVKHLFRAQHCLNSTGDTRDTENTGPARTPWEELQGE